MEICEFIKINLISKISSLKGTINYIELFKHFDYMNIDDIFIKEYQTLPLKTIFEKGIFLFWI